MVDLERVLGVLFADIGYDRPAEIVGVIVVMWGF